MAEVTKSNFEEFLPEINDAIQSATFIAIDTEFTGLDLGDENTGSLFDSIQDRYLKLRARANSFVPCQIGLSTFTKSSNENMYNVRTYVFYIRPYMFGSCDRKFMFQASSLDFLCKYDFDFNKFLKEGIPFLNEVEEQLVRSELEDGSICFPHEKLRDIKSRRKTDILINNQFQETVPNAPTTNINITNTDVNEKLILPRDTITHEYFQLNELRHRYPSLWAYCENDMVIIERVSSKRKEELQKKYHFENEEESLLNYYLGFTKVFRLLKHSKKPIVGHNLLMDLLLFYQNFHKPLPSSYTEFKQELNSLFPTIFDTRHIWLHVKKFYKLKDIPTQSGLFDLCEMFQNTPDVLSTLYSPDISHKNSERYSCNEFPHESGYDSYITGWVFVKICHLLAMKRVVSATHVQPQSFSQHLKAVAPFVNKLNLGRSRIRYIDTSEEDPPQCGPDFLYVRPRNKKTPFNLKQLSRHFDQYGIVEFKMLASRSALMATTNIRSHEEILRDFKDNGDFIVTKYNAFRHSSLLTSALWITGIGSGCMVAVLVAKLITSN